ncbi:MAG: preprotein translocase subunit SecA [Candidatus Paceibacterota bacterium]|jgi:preprotein translocase subunit SecA
MAFLENIFGSKEKRVIAPLRPIVEKINAFEATIKVLSDQELKAKTNYFKGILASGKTLDDILPEAFAVVREASRRTLGQRHFDVQMMGGIVLHQGDITEMRTGEGKTLVATLPAYLNALTGKGVHVVTVNDYLARRDGVWMGQIYNFLGLSLGVINHDVSFLYDPNHGRPTTDNQALDKSSGQATDGEDKVDKVRDTEGSYKVIHEFLRPCSRKEAYGADITYGTNNEYGFDYLRDNIEYSPQELRQREFNYAIVDEIDSILIDEARTPLIISSPTVESENLYVTFAGIVKNFTKEADYILDEKMRAVSLTPLGIEKAEKALGVENIYTDKGIKYVHHLETAARAKAMYEKDRHYVVRDGEVVIVDEFTGRLQPGRRWSEGLHQAIEAKEGVAIQKESRTFASITFQNYFRLYKKLSGMTGTAMTSSEEFYKVYGLEVVAIPTNVSVARIDHQDLIFKNETGKYQAITKKIKELYTKGQPVLIGTVAIENNEILSGYFTRAGIPHKVLNAKNHEQEGEIIAQAGHRGAVTIATNMAGRGVDIKLGGVPFNEEKYKEVKSFGGLYVIGTERHEARRIDNQLRGRSGRQGDPGETQFYVSLEDSLMRVFAGDTVKKMMNKLSIPDDEPIQHRILTRALESAQTKIEGFNFDSRKQVLEYDDVMNHQRKTIYKRRRGVLFGDRETIDRYLVELVEGDADRELIEERKKTLGEEEFYSVVRRLLLQTIDMFWVEHLEMMDYLRGSVNLRAYGQRDPLIEYKKEGLRLFREMEDSVRGEVFRLLPHIGIGAFVREEERMKKEVQQIQLAGVADTSDKGGGPGVASSENKIGRNDPCPCGSGRKWKQCGLINTPFHKKS